MWAAIVISGLLFGLGHLPGYLVGGCKGTPLFIGAMLSLNLWASLIFGWPFWRFGLLAAMMAHALFHLVWLLFGMHFQQTAGRRPGQRPFGDQNIPANELTLSRRQSISVTRGEVQPCYILASGPGKARDEATPAGAPPISNE